VLLFERTITVLGTSVRREVVCKNSSFILGDYRLTL